MNGKKSLKIIRYVIISLAVGTTLYVILDELRPHGHEENIKELNTTVESGFGEITLFENKNFDAFSQNYLYRNDELGFQISKPNSEWEINSMFTGDSDEEYSKWRGKGLLDGIYVEQNGDRRFMVAIFDVKQKDVFRLSDYIDNQIKQAQGNSDIVIPIRYVSELNDWAIFAIQKNPPMTGYYGEQLLYFKDGILYMLLYSGAAPQTLDSDKKLEFHSIMDSFEMI